MTHGMWLFFVVVMPLITYCIGYSQARQYYSRRD
jgi:hypothetical protein